MTTKLKPCPECNTEISRSAKSCPSCGKEFKSDLATLPSIQVDDIDPKGDVSLIYKYNSDFTDLQRQNYEKEIIGKHVQWTLPIYEVKKSKKGYRIQTYDKNPLDDQNIVNTFIDIVPQNDNDIQVIENLKTDDLLTVKGKIKEVRLRHIVLSPAIIIN